jgi:hypothetical protein
MLLVKTTQTHPVPALIAVKFSKEANPTKMHSLAFSKVLPSAGCHQPNIHPINPKYSLEVS